MAYDEKCEELAEYFLPSSTSRQTIKYLAQRIQDYIEDELADMISEAKNPDPYI